MQQVLVNNILEEFEEEQRNEPEVVPSLEAAQRSGNDYGVVEDIPSLVDLQKALQGVEDLAQRSGPVSVGISQNVHSLMPFTSKARGEGHKMDDSRVL